MRTLVVKVRPSARVDELAPLPDGSWQARVKAPAVDGRANAALLALVAEHFAVPRARVTLRSGQRGRNKRIDIAD